MYSAVTRNIRVTVRPDFSDAHSAPEQRSVFLDLRRRDLESGASAPCNCCVGDGSSPTRSATSRPSRDPASSASSRFSSAGREFLLHVGLPARDAQRLDGGRLPDDRRGRREQFEVEIPAFSLDTPLHAPNAQLTD